MNTRPHPAPALSAAEQRRLGAALAGASDKALVRIVAAFDNIPDRREMDTILDAARPRLRRLRPARPIALTRLLFLPLDGAITDPRQWKRAGESLPRTALAPMTEALRGAIGPALARLEAGFAGRDFSDIAAVEAAGLELWRLAAAAAPQVARSGSWKNAGMNDTDFACCLDLAAGVWRHAEPLWSTLLVSRHGPPEEDVRRVLGAAAGETPAVIEALLATLLLKAARPGGVASAAVRAAPPGAAERALDRWIDACHPDIMAGDPKGAAHIAEEFAEIIEDLEASAAARHPERRQRIAALRHQVDTACRSGFNDGVQQSLLVPLAKPAAALDDATFQGFEATARSLKRLEQAGRSIGGASAYDAALRRITDDLGGLRSAPDSGATPADLARLVEILAGPEAALRLLDAG